MSNIIISPKTKIYDLLEAYPQVEDELIRLVPAFSKLKNPVLRKTIARVTTLQQAALVGRVDIGLIINKLREIIGYDLVLSSDDTSFKESEVPEWFNKNKIIKTLDARPLLAKGEHPIELVSKECRALNKGEIFELITDFLPAPLIEMMKNKGYVAWYRHNDENIYSTYLSPE